jgi:hypothetical protein
MRYFGWVFLAALIIATVGKPVPAQAAEPLYELATFSADVTVPLGHRSMGVLPTKSQKIEDPLECRGFVFLGAGKPVVLAAVDWCEIRNGAYDQWRDALAGAAETSRERVILCSLHQHDAPVTDSGAQKLLDAVGLKGELYDVEFQADCLRRVAAAIRKGLASPRHVTQVGIGQAKVDRVASNRRVVHPDGRVSFSRGSRSGADAFHRDAPEGEIDPYLKTLSFWDGDTPLVALHVYATHPMSYYGQGGVTADFVGLARRRRQADDPRVFTIYASGASGDVTAGKYNDGSPAMRPVLAERLHQAMQAAWQATQKRPLAEAAFRWTQLDLPFSELPLHTANVLQRTLESTEAKVTDRILAAMSLSSRQRVEAGQRIDLPCLDLGPAQLVLLPGESFVGYQLMAQRLRPESFVITLGYGECWPGYIPTPAAEADNFRDVWLWVGPGCEPRVREALMRVLQRQVK